MSSVLIVTGGSTGIGAATARLAARQGYHVCVNFLQRCDAAEEVVSGIRDASGVAVAVQADISVEATYCASSRRRTANSGVSPRWSTTPQPWSPKPVSIRWTLAARWPPATLVCHQCDRQFPMRARGASPDVYPLWRQRRRNRQCLFHSGTLRFSRKVRRLRGNQGALDTMTVGLAKEVAEEGIRVNAVRPGFIYTRMHAKGGEPGRVDRVKSLVPMQRGGQPEEVAAAILWLLSGEASYITGTILDVAGGR